MSIYYQNTQRIRGESSEFVCNVLVHDFDVIILTETWLCDSHFNAEYFDDRYTVLRQDRNLCKTGKSKGGGVSVSAFDHFNLQLLDSCDDMFDCIIAKMLFGREVVYICAVYFPPNSDVILYEELFKRIECHCPQGSTIFLIGDFNLSEIEGTDFDFMRASEKCQMLYNFMSYFDLQSFNNVFNSNKRTLDLVLSNKDLVVTREYNPLVSEDKHHPALNITVMRNMIGKLKTKCNISGYNFKKADFTKLYVELMETNWDILNEYKDVNVLVDTFYNIIYRVLDRCVPHRKQSNTKYPCWFNRSIINKIKMKSKYHSKIRKGGKYKGRHELEFRRLRRELKVDIREAYRTFLSSSENSILKNPQQLWKFVKNKTRHLPAGPLTFEGREMRDNDEIANCFAQYFQSVFANTASADSDGRELNMFSWEQLDMLCISEISLTEIEDAIKHLKPKTSVGSDGIPPYVVKGCADSLKHPLLMAFNLSLKTCTFPNKWKSGLVCPIPKGGNKNDIRNYRPIAVLSAFAKIFEQVLFNRILPHVKPTISVSQHGFMKQRSTITNLAIITDVLAKALDNGKQVDVIYIDYEKAFDKVDHNILLAKLNCFQFSSPLIRFFSSYLSNRKQSVLYKQFMSKEYIVRSGVPQGSNLGPLFFLLFINDLPEIISGSDKLLFADDFKIFTHVDSINDAVKLQDNLNNVLKWCDKNKLQVNVNKCKVLSFTRKKMQINFPYAINGMILPRPESMNDLGVTFDTTLSFNTHIVNIVNESYRFLGFIARLGKDFNNTDTLRQLFNSYVRSKLEYATVIWNPNSQIYIKKLEGIQAKFLRFLTYKTTGMYPKYDNFNTLARNYQILTLEERRTLHDMLFLQKIFLNKIDCMELTSKIKFQVPSLKTRPNNNDLFFCERARTNILVKSPFWRISAAYNEICTMNNVVDVFTMSATLFKSVITEILFTQKTL